LAPVFVAVFVFVVAGCGGGGTPADESATAAGKASDGNATQLSKTAFIKQADAICAEGREELSAAAQSVFGAKDDEREGLELGLVGDVLVPVLETEIDDLRAMGAPPGDEEEVDKIVDEMEEVLQVAEEEPQAFILPPDPSIKWRDPWRAADKRAGEYGFRECPRS
jgi:hypothetical protein